MTSNKIWFCYSESESYWLSLVTPVLTFLENWLLWHWSIDHHMLGGWGKGRTCMFNVASMNKTDSSQSWPGKNKDKTKWHRCDLQPDFVVVWPTATALTASLLMVKATEERENQCLYSHWQNGRLAQTKACFMWWMYVFYVYNMHKCDRQQWMPTCFKWIQTGSEHLTNYIVLHYDTRCTMLCVLTISCQLWYQLWKSIIPQNFPPSPCSCGKWQLCPCIDCSMISETQIFTYVQYKVHYLIKKSLQQRTRHFFWHLNVCLALHK